MIAHDRGLVLRTFKLRETSKIICLLSRQHGKLRLVARGVRAPRSRTGASLEVGNELDFVFSQKPGQDLGYLREATLVHPWLAQGRRLELLGLGWAVLELLERVLPEGGPEGGQQESEGALLGILGEYLQALQESPSRASALLLFYSFELRLLEHLGIQPDVDRCRVCDLKTGDVIWLDVEAGNCTCADCRVAGPIAFEVPSAVVQILRSLLEKPWRTAGLKSQPETRRQLGMLLHRLLSRHLERYRYPRSLRLLRRPVSPSGLSGDGGEVGFQDLEVLKSLPGDRA